MPSRKQSFLEGKPQLCDVQYRQPIWKTHAWRHNRSPHHFWVTIWVEEVSADPTFVVYIRGAHWRLETMTCPVTYDLWFPRPRLGPATYEAPISVAKFDIIKLRLNYRFVLQDEWHQGFDDFWTTSSRNKSYHMSLTRSGDPNHAADPRGTWWPLPSTIGHGSGWISRIRMGLVTWTYLNKWRKNF